MNYNVEVITRNMNPFDAPVRYDRMVSVQMFEHLRNFHVLFRRVSEWLRQDGVA